MKSMSKMRDALNRGLGEERRETARADKRRAGDAFAAHLGALDELMRECDESADRFVECVNAWNEEEEELARTQAANGRGAMMGDGLGGGQREEEEGASAPSLLGERVQPTRVLVEGRRLRRRGRGRR